MSKPIYDVVDSNSKWTTFLFSFKQYDVYQYSPYTNPTECIYFLRHGFEIGEYKVVKLDAKHHYGVSNKNLAILKAKLLLIGINHE